MLENFMYNMLVKRNYLAIVVKINIAILTHCKVYVKKLRLSQCLKYLDKSLTPQLLYSVQIMKDNRSGAYSFLVALNFETKRFIWTLFRCR